jgi:hypothetical protein
VRYRWRRKMVNRKADEWDPLAKERKRMRKTGGVIWATCGPVLEVKGFGSARARG